MSLRPDPSSPGLNYTFSKLVQRALALANDRAKDAPIDVAPEHLLLGLLGVGEGVALSVLKGLGVNPREILERAEQSLAGGGDESVLAEHVSFTDGAKMVLHFALAEARELDSTYVGTEHLLLALLRMEDTMACQVLNAVGLRIEEARAETLRLWKAGGDEAAEGDNFADRSTTQILRDLLGPVHTNGRCVS